MSREKQQENITLLGKKMFIITMTIVRKYWKHFRIGIRIMIIG